LALQPIIANKNPSPPKLAKQSHQISLAAGFSKAEVSERTDETTKSFI